MVPISPISFALGFSRTRNRGWLVRFTRKGRSPACSQYLSLGSHRKTWKSHVTEACSPLQHAALSGTHNGFTIKIAARKWIESEFDSGYVKSGENIF